MKEQMPPQISVIIPALNEAESIGQVVSEMPLELISECIVVDNGSTDATASVAAQAGARVVQSPRGYGAACQGGSKAALSSSTILVFMDGDGSDVVSDLPRLVDRRPALDVLRQPAIRRGRRPGTTRVVERALATR